MRMSNDNSPIHINGHGPEPRRRQSALPEGLRPRGFRRAGAAAYVGVSPGTFDGMVRAGTMPQPKIIGTCRVWDIRALDRAFDELPGGDDHGDDVGGIE
jgi:hypothetical protein